MKAKYIHAGQTRPYADSVYEIEIDANLEAMDAEVWAFAQTKQPCAHRDDRQNHNGYCGFPYGLESYGSLRNEGPGKWRYTVTCPYCD